MFGKKFKVLKELPYIHEKVGDRYPEYLIAREENGLLIYEIMDEYFGFPSLANTDNGAYAIKLRSRSSKILSDLMDKGIIEEIDESEIKYCRKCEQTLKIEEFPIVKGKPYTYCRECKRELQRVWVKEKRQSNPRKYIRRS